ncbi:aspartate ammonia-lyase [[Clostridium] fimetarium]|uniref:Aspartate ammonia-lyase n=1 Tax=[Clostridium] fimetarium TaxID=99656 RepID=A0A1I0QHG7_9FIRM|nr:aspartate ammonia-lyase [[Clostridium] fimetarium]SEW26294.1 aspartate ammonia-lyase [[Clostridium] fimetarium]
MRMEKDSIGEKSLGDSVVYGIQTARAKENFNLNYKNTDQSLIAAIVQIKKAAAHTYQTLGIGKPGVYEAIEQCCDLILAGGYEDAFITSALQGGAGTSTNMNVNEVLANLALVKLGHQYGEYQYVHPLDDVNRGQSTNDVYPTALRIAAIEKLRVLSDKCSQLQQTFQQKENAFDHIQKLGRTELMDALPITLGQEFGAYAQAISRDRWRLYKVEERLRQVNLGGTAVGAGNNADRKYRFGILEILRGYTGMGLSPAEYPMDITQNNDVFVEVSGLMKSLAVNLMKISNDIRLMSSGPKGGFGEITLKALQMGSTIMPGKVNPVIPEMVMQVAMKVIANDSAITMAASHGEFELNAFMPLIADSLLESLQLLIDAVESFRTKCVEHILPDEERCRQLLEASYAFATAYTVEYGYDLISEAMKESNGDPLKLKEILEELE